MTLMSLPSYDRLLFHCFRAAPDATSVTKFLPSEVLSTSLPSTVTFAGEEGDGEPRPCSVRGCTSMTTGVGKKMCDVCRGRHRVYASTKRAKRKLEKAAAGLQALAQIPIAGEQQGDHSLLSGWTNDTGANDAPKSLGAKSAHDAKEPAAVSGQVQPSFLD
jgi:hypothetical protein